MILANPAWDQGGVSRSIKQSNNHQLVRSDCRTSSSQNISFCQLAPNVSKYCLIKISSKRSGTPFCLRVHAIKKRHPNKTPFSQSLAFYTETSHAQIDWRDERDSEKTTPKQRASWNYTNINYINLPKSIFPKPSNKQVDSIPSPTKSPQIFGKKSSQPTKPETNSPGPWPFLGSWPWLGAWSHGPVRRWPLASRTRHLLAHPRLASGGPPVKGGREICLKGTTKNLPKMVGREGGFEVWKHHFFLKVRH